jgi:DNA-directed RNA polymerase
MDNNLDDLLATEFRQIELNNQMKALGSSKFIGNTERVEDIRGYGATDPGRRLGNSAINGFVEQFESYVVKQLEQSSRSVIMKLDIANLLDPIQMGKIVIRCLLSAIMRPSDKKITVVGVVFHIGREIEIAIKQAMLDMYHEKDVKRAMDSLVRQGKTGDNEEFVNIMKRVAEDVELDHKDWTEASHGRVGQILLQLLYTSPVQGHDNRYFSDIFDEYTSKKYVSGGVVKTKHIRMTQLGMQWLNDNEELLASFSISYLPMVKPPKNWTNMFDGGYHDPSIRKTYCLIKSNRRNALELYEKFPSGFDCIIKAINNIQQTPFRVNGYVLDAVKYIHENQINLETKGVPIYEPAYEYIIGKEAATEYFSLRKKLTRDENNLLTDDSKALLLSFVRGVVEGSSAMEEKEVWKEWYKLRLSITKYAEGDFSKRILLTNIIRESSDFLDQDIYFAYNADYRGRLYPLSGQFSPQGSDTSRGLLEFANGVKPDSKGAIRSIAIEIANNFGVDKVSFEDRAKWTEDNTQTLIDCAEDFVKHTFWQEADKPFLFLAGCREWAKVIDARKRGDEFDFISTLPCGFDGSCNGIQHYSALFRDPIGAAAVNLINHSVPADVYREVADKALELTRKENSKIAKMVDEVNTDLEGKLFGRDVAKRSVMCLPYGVSQGSSNKYVYEMVEKHMKGYTDVVASQKKVIRSYMGKAIWTAITHVVEKPVSGKEYFQSMANELAESGSGLSWFTPTGFPVKQMMMKKDIKSNRIRMTVNGKTLTRQYPKYTKEIDAREQANAVAPNYIHSFDSSHLQLTVNASYDEGIRSFLFIHDSFATDCNNSERFNKIIREEFVKMYHDNHLGSFHKHVAHVLGREPEVAPQELGNFDLNKVLGSDYFFS